MSHSHGSYVTYCTVTITEQETNRIIEPISNGSQKGNLTVNRDLATQKKGFGQKN